MNEEIEFSKLLTGNQTAELTNLGTFNIRRNEGKPAEENGR